MKELERLGSPAYPDPAWWRALSRAIAADEQSRITRIREEALSCYDVAERHPRRRTIEELESRLIGARCSRWLAARGVAADWH